MSASRWRTEYRYPRRQRARGIPLRWPLAIAALGGAFLLAAMMSQASGPGDVGPTASPPGPDQGPLFSRDMRLTIQVRQAFAADAALARLFIRVEVREGVATLRGSVPSDDHVSRAEELVKKIIGIRKVRNELRVGAPREAPVVPVAPEEDKPVSSHSASPDRLTGTIAVPTSRVPPIALPPNGRDASAPPAAPAPAGIRPPTVSLLAPVSAEALGPAAPPAPVAPQVSAPAPAAPSLAEAVERLRRSDARFVGVGTQVEGNVVAVWPASADTAAENVMAFAQLVSRTPGVGRVVLRNGAGPR